MKLLKQPNAWSCFPTSLCMMLDKKVEDFFLFVGHNGSEIVDPEAPAPWCFRAFHPRELIDFAHVHGYLGSWIEKYPLLAVGQKVVDVKFKMCSPNFKRFIREHNSIMLCGEFDTMGRHAVVKFEDKVYDPRGVIHNDISHFVDKSDAVFAITSYFNS